MAENDNNFPGCNNVECCLLWGHGSPCIPRISVSNVLKPESSLPKLWSQKVEDRLQDIEATITLFKTVMNDAYDKIAVLEAWLRKKEEGEIDGVRYNKMGN